MDNMSFLISFFVSIFKVFVLSIFIFVLFMDFDMMFFILVDNIKRNMINGLNVNMGF